MARNRREALEEIDRFHDELGEMGQFFDSAVRQDVIALQWMDVAYRALANALYAAEGRPVASPRRRR